MYSSSILIDRVSDLCKKRNISINQMLKEANLSISVIDNIKRNRIPSIDKIDALATFFECSIDYLVGRTDIGNYFNNSSYQDLDENEIVLLQEFSKLNKESKHSLLQYLSFMTSQAQNLKNYFETSEIDA